MDITLAREQTIADIILRVELEKNIAVHTSVKKKIFFPPTVDGYAASILNFIPGTCAQSLMRDHLVVIDDNDDRNRFKISLNTNASHECVCEIGKIEICNWF